jgi:hypothetical protein
MATISGQLCTISAQIDMAYNPAELRGEDGEWAAGLAALRSQHPDVQLEVSKTAGSKTAGLSLIRSTDRGKGHAGAALKGLTSLADKHGVTLHLTPEPLAGDRTTKKARLTQWYKSHGFVPNSGRNKDYAISDTMLRPPVAP